MTRRVIQKPMRPLFEIDLDGVDGEHVLEQLASQLRVGDSPVRGMILTRKAELTTCAARCHTWSPWLSLQFGEGAGGEQLLSGRFAPHPNVWTGFMAAYGVLLMLAIFGTMFGLSQWTLHMSPWGLLAAPLAMAVGALVYAAAIVGQRLGAEEMHVLRDFVDHAVRSSRANAVCAHAPQGALGRPRFDHAGTEPAASVMEVTRA